MSHSGVQRVRYFDGQFLDAADFEAEQQYHLDALRRHALSQHDWGIVQGLALGIREGTVTVDAGVALDGYGRSLVLPLRRILTVDNKEQLRMGHNAMSLWLEYAVAEREGDASRLEENPILRTRFHAKDAKVEPEPLPGTTLYQACAAWQELPLDASARWPILLGAIVFGPQSDGYPLVEKGGRHYSGLRAGWLQSPGGDIRVDLSDPDQDAIFTVTFQDEAKDEAATAKGVPALTLAADGTLSLDKMATFEHGLSIVDGALEFADTNAKEVESPGWRIYRHRDQETGGEELRIEIQATEGEGAEAEPAPKNSFTVGAYGLDGKTFVPGLTVSDDRLVTVHGDLHVDGQINPAPKPAGEERLAPTAAQALKSAALAAQSGALARASAKPPESPLGKLRKKVEAVWKKVKTPAKGLLAAVALAASFLGGAASESDKPFLTAIEEKATELLQTLWPGTAEQPTQTDKPGDDAAAPAKHGGATQPKIQEDGASDAKKQTAPQSPSNLTVEPSN